MKKLIIFGAGGLGREVAWLVERINKKVPTWEIIGFMDDDESIQNTMINGYKVIGKSADIIHYSDVYLVCAVGSSVVREHIINTLKSIVPDIKFGTIIDPSVDISQYVLLGEGSIICAHTLVTVNISIGSHVIINPNCTIGHDAVLQDFVTLYPAVNISGMTNIGHATELGVGMQIIQGKTVGDYSIVGAGAVVVKDIPSKCTAVGIPAKPIKYIE